MRSARKEVRHEARAGRVIDGVRQGGGGAKMDQKQELSDGGKLWSS